MKKLLLALFVLVPALASAQIAPYPLGVTPPIFGLPASAVNGGGTFSPQLFGPESCTTPAYSFTGATTSGYGFASSTACVVIGSTQILGVSATATTSGVVYRQSIDGATGGYVGGLGVRDVHAAVRRRRLLRRSHRLA